MTLSQHSKLRTCWPPSLSSKRRDSRSSGWMTLMPSASFPARPQPLRPWPRISPCSRSGRSHRGPSCPSSKPCRGQSSCSCRRRGHRQIQRWPVGWWPGPWGSNTTERKSSLLPQVSCHLEAPDSAVQTRLDPNTTYAFTDRRTASCPHWNYCGAQQAFVDLVPETEKK